MSSYPKLRRNHHTQAFDPSRVVACKHCMVSLDARHVSDQLHRPMLRSQELQHLGSFDWNVLECQVANTFVELRLIHSTRTIRIEIFIQIDKVV